jgi:hypothetical protein
MDFVIVTYWWGGNSTCRNSKNNLLKTTKRPVSYRTLVGLLEQKCRKLGIPFYSEELHFSSYEEGIRYKPTFIRRQLERWQLPVLYMDCDIYIHEYPEMILHTDKRYDFIAFNWYADPRVNGPCVSPVVFDWHTLYSCGGLLYFNYTQRAFELLHTWSDAILQYPAKADDRLLDICFMKLRHKLYYYWFPIEYLYLPQCFKKPKGLVMSHPFVLTEHNHRNDLIPEDHAKYVYNQVQRNYTHVIETIHNLNMIRCLQDRNKGLKAHGLIYTNV